MPVRPIGRSGSARPFWASVAGLVLINSAVLAQPARTPTDPTGEWLVAKQVARIKIADCDGRLWGVVAWEAQPGGMDKKNPDPNLRSRPTLGMPILLGMTPSKTNRVGRTDLQLRGRPYVFGQHQPGGSEYSARAGMFSRIFMRRGKLDAFRKSGRDRFDATHAGKVVRQPENGSRRRRAGRDVCSKTPASTGFFP